MGVRLAELRARCQLPVRRTNDVAGLLFGDWASLPITKLFVDLRLSPDVATLGMLVTGLAGSALQWERGAFALAGAALLVLYYLLDCVDGEVARFRGVEDMRWGYYDYLFHLLVKPTSFVLVGIGTWRETGEDWPLVAGAVAAVATLWLKIFLQIPGILFLHGVMNGRAGGSRAFRRFLATLRLDESEVAAQAPPPRRDEDVASAVGARVGGEAARPAVSRPDFPLGFNLVTLRALMTNYDVGLVLLLAAALADLWLPPLDLGPVCAACPFRGLWLLFYALVLPCDFLDYVRTYLRAGHFASETRRLLMLAHHYRFEPLGEAELPAPQRGAERSARP